MSVHDQEHPSDVEGCPRCTTRRMARVDAALNNVDQYEDAERPKAVWPPEEERR